MSHKADKPRVATPARQPIEAAADPSALLRLEVVMAITGFRKSTVYAATLKRGFPAPIRLSGRCSRWRAGEVRAWLDQQGRAA